MRKLTVRRQKTFVACLGTLQIFISDSASDRSLLDTPVRLLCSLKNGEEATVEVPEEAFSLFAAFDSVSADYCVDAAQIPAGTEDVTVSGKCRFNPWIGNPFRFDGGETPEKVLKARKKQTLRMAIVSAVVFAACFCLSWLAVRGFGSGSSRKEKVFEVNGLSLTLDGTFSVEELSEDEANIDSKNEWIYTAVFRPSELGDSDVKSAEDLIRALLDFSQFTVPTGFATENGMTYLEIEYESDGYKYSSFITALQGNDCWYYLEFTTVRSKYASLRDQILQHAKSAVVTGS